MTSVVENIHRIREEYAKRFGNDLHAICEDARAKQGRDGRRVVELKPRRAADQPPFHSSIL